MPVYGPWQEVPPGFEHRQTFPRTNGLKGAIEQGVTSATATYTVQTLAASRTAAKRTDGTFVTFTAFDQNKPSPDFTYTPQNQQGGSRSGLYKGLLTQFVERWTPNQDPDDLLDIVRPPGALYAEWDGDAFLDYEVNFGPWTVPMQDDYVEVYPQAGQAWYNAYGDGNATLVPAATFRFDVAVLDEAAMNLAQVSPAIRSGQGPAPWDLAVLHSEVRNLPERAHPGTSDLDRVDPGLTPVRVRPVDGQWIAVGVWCDWWPSDIGRDVPARVRAEASFEADVFFIVRDWPPYRWVYPDGHVFPTPARYGWGVVL